MKVRNLKRCPCCNRDVSTFDEKGQRWAVVFTYEGAGAHIQIKCKCGMQTKKVHVSNRELVYNIWNKRKGVI